MALLDFYTFDLTSIVIILLIALAVFSFLNYIESEKDKNFTFNLTVSIVSGILSSILYSFLTLESDEILTSNYWD